MVGRVPACACVYVQAEQGTSVSVRGNPGPWRRLHLTKMDVDENNAASVRSASSRRDAASAASGGHYDCWPRERPPGSSSGVSLPQP